MINSNEKLRYVKDSFLALSAVCEGHITIMIHNVPSGLKFKENGFVKDGFEHDGRFVRTWKYDDPLGQKGDLTLFVKNDEN